MISKSESIVFGKKSKNVITQKEEINVHFCLLGKVNTQFERTFRKPTKAQPTLVMECEKAFQKLLSPIHI